MKDMKHNFQTIGGNILRSKSNIIWVLAVFSLMLFSGMTYAQEESKESGPDPEQKLMESDAAAWKEAEQKMMASDWKFHDIADVNFVKQNLKIPPVETVMIIDSRPYQPKYVNGHIPTAVNIPDSKFDQMKDTLPKDKNALLIFYCGGFECKLSHKSAKKAEEMGYTNVKVFAAGYPGWIRERGNYAAVGIEYVQSRIEENKMILVDSRPQKAKYDKGHIPTAISIPDSDFDALKGKLPRDPANLLVFYCEGFECKLSHQSAAKAIALGYTNVKVFSAGYPAWKKAFGENAAAVPVKSGKEEGSIDIETFKKILDEKPDSIMLIDVRDKDEFKEGHFRTAVNMTVDEVEKNIKTLPTDKTIVFVCSTGARSGEAFYLIKDLRPEMKNVLYVEAGVKFNKDGSYTIRKTE